MTRSTGKLGPALALAAAVAVAAAWTGGPASAGGGDDDGDAVLLRAESMVGVPAGLTLVPFRDREIIGGGLPWTIDDADVELSQDGDLRVRVEGLTLLSGINPSPTFRAVLSCITVVGGVASNRNSMSDAFPATMPAGDAEARVHVDVPDPCIAPVVFVTNGAGTRWFAATGSGA